MTARDTDAASDLAGFVRETVHDLIGTNCISAEDDVRLLNALAAEAIKAGLHHNVGLLPGSLIRHIDARRSEEAA